RPSPRTPRARSQRSPSRFSARSATATAPRSPNSQRPDVPWVMAPFRSGSNVAFPGKACLFGKAPASGNFRAAYPFIRALPMNAEPSPIESLSHIYAPPPAISPEPDIDKPQRSQALWMLALSIAAFGLTCVALFIPQNLVVVWVAPI